jgi:hypothetical protein
MYNTEDETSRREKNLTSNIYFYGFFIFMGLALLALLTTGANAVEPAPCIGFDCNIEKPVEPTEIKPAPAVIDLGSFKLPLFDSHIEAEQHWYHCALGVGIWGDMIKGFVPDFETPDILNFIAPINPFACNGFEIYPESQLCSKFKDQEEAESHYSSCKTTNKQYWDYLAFLQSVPAPTPPSQCKRFGGQNIWKVNSETRPTTVMLLDQSYCFDDRSIQNDMRPLNIYLNDINGNRISNGSLRHCNRENGGRLHYDFPRGSGEAIVEILFEDETIECFYVPDRSRDQR